MKTNDLLEEIEEIIDDVTAPAGNLDPNFYGRELKKQIRVALFDYLDNAISTKNEVNSQKTSHNSTTKDDLRQSPGIIHSEIKKELNKNYEKRTKRINSMRLGNDVLTNESVGTENE